MRHGREQGHGEGNHEAGDGAQAGAEGEEGRGDVAPEEEGAREEEGRQEERRQEQRLEQALSLSCRTFPRGAMQRSGWSEKTLLCGEGKHFLSL